MQVDDERGNEAQNIDTGTQGGRDAGADAGADNAGGKQASEQQKGATQQSGGDQGNKDWFGPDWRDRITQGLPEDQRGKAADYLKVRNSPYDILRSGMAADSKIQELMQTRIKVPTGKGDDPKDVAAFRKAIGVPEKVDDYKFDPPKDYGEFTPFDEELKDEFLKGAHEKNLNQQQIDYLKDTYWAIEKRKVAAQATQIARAQQSAVDELHNEFGREYRPTVELINRMFETELPEAGLSDPDERRAFLSQRFSNGMALGEYPPFVKMMAKIARERADDGAFVVGEGGDGVDIDSKIDKIMAKMHTEPKEYERMQPELKRLIAAQERRKSRKG